MQTHKLVSIMNIEGISFGSLWETKRTFVVVAGNLRTYALMEFLREVTVCARYFNLTFRLDLS